MSSDKTPKQSGIDPRTKPRKRRWVLRAIAGCLLILTAALGTMVYLARSAPAQRREDVCRHFAGLVVRTAECR